MNRFYLSKLSILAVLLGCSVGAKANTVSTFAYTGAVQTYSVPAGVFSLTVDDERRCRW